MSLNKQDLVLNLKRLQESQIHRREECESQIVAWKKYESDYQLLKDRLETLPHQVRHDVMVPFGKLALMPGQLVHTNEVMVLLGDGWFVERSAKQATEIVERRIEQCKQMLEDLEKERVMLESWQQQTEEIGQESQAVEIKQEYKEEEERLWREQHRKNIKKYKQEERQRKEKASGLVRTDEDMWRRLDQLEKEEEEGQTEEESAVIRAEEDQDARDREQRKRTEEELWRRLDELEREEELADERAKLEEGSDGSNEEWGSSESFSEEEVDEKTPPVYIYSSLAERNSDEKCSVKPKKKFSWCESLSVEHEALEPLRITFSHSGVNESVGEGDGICSRVNATEGDGSGIRSPADLYKLVKNEKCNDVKTLKPILRNAPKHTKNYTVPHRHAGLAADPGSVAKSVPEGTVAEVTSQDFPADPGPKPFIGVVKERDIEPTSSEEGEVPLPSQRPLSKFRASRRSKS